MRSFAACALTLLAATGSTAPAQGPATRLSRRIEYWNPSWSPDGRWLVFESTLGGTFAIYTISPDGSNLRRLTSDSANSEQPSWSPDGRVIVFSSDRGGRLEIHRMNADGTAPRRLAETRSGSYYQSSFSPDGRWIAFQGREDQRETRDRVYVVGADGTGLHLVSDSSVSAEGPRWSRDGGTLRFSAVPYRKRFWSEMTPADGELARASARIVAVRPDGTGQSTLDLKAGESDTTWSRDGSRGFLTSSRDGSEALYLIEANRPARRIASSSRISSPAPSPHGNRLAYTRHENGWAGLYVYDIEARSERLIAGGPGAGPLGYLRTAVPVAMSDTFASFTTSRSGGARGGGGSWFVRAMRRLAGSRWESVDTWYDSSGTVVAVQSTRTARASLATELETVRAISDSASLLVTPERITGWVVPTGGTARLVDGPSTAERYAVNLVLLAIAQAKPSDGRMFVAPVGGLFGPAPLESRVDSILVTGRAVLQGPSGGVPTLILDGPNGRRYWVEEGSGRLWAARGPAGPDRWWWHVRRGVREPS